MICPTLLNNQWYFKSEYVSEDCKDADINTFQQVHLPHTVKELPFNCFSHDETAMQSSYLKILKIPSTDQGKRIILRFDGVMAYFDLYCNGTLVSSHRGGYSRCYIDITENVHFGKENRIYMMVDSTERNDIPPFGYIVDFLTYGGIYRDVYLYKTNPIYISNIMVRYHLEEKTRLILEPEVFLENYEEAKDLYVKFRLLDKEGKVQKEEVKEISARKGPSSYQVSSFDAGIVKLWDLQNPELYTLETELLVDNTILDKHISRTGFRHVECTNHGFYLNGEKIKLIGVNRHQSYPYQGYAMGRNVQRKDADIIKQELSCNTVRTSHYMQSEHFLNRCDELGILVFEEIPGWHYIGDDVYQSVVINDVEKMITTDYNHPSIFIWGVRLNESNDSPELYTKTNALAKRLDPQRATTGVRYFKGSELKEDVYAINDFCHKGSKREEVLQNQRQVTGLNYDVPFMVSEFCGHVYPCKPWDNENVREEHARMHARVQSKSACTDNLLGALAWCAFDYQTHGDYGSGDKICYHGIMDMYRMPKFASYLYRSQKTPKEEIVLETTSVFSRGEKGDNKVAPVIIMTNCDYIEVELYGSKIGAFYPSNNYVGLPHPPIEIKTHDSFWIEIWQGAVITGYINHEPVIQKKFVRDAYLTTLDAKADDTVLSCNYADDTRVACRFLDQEGNLLPYYPGVLSVELEGDVELRGPKIFPAMGGMAAFWIRSTATGKPGIARINIKTLNSALPDVSIEICLEDRAFPSW